MPEISVLMPIRNCADTLPEAIDSILRQSFPDWELILCDDGSTDNTRAVASSYAERFPEKLRLLVNPVNLGLNRTLNRCLAEAKGRYIARMDGDDRCSPDRFEKERAVLEAEQDIALVSSAMTHFDEAGEWGLQTHPERPSARDFLHGSPFCHAPCMMRREACLAVGGYSEGKRLLRVEDYHLWMKLYAAGYRGRNLPEPLYSMRDDRAARKRRRFRYRLNEAYVRALCVRRLHLPLPGYLFALRPILVGLLPARLYDLLHKRRMKGGCP